MSPEEKSLLEALLFDEKTSRNKEFERFEAADAKRIHRIAKTLRSIQKELAQEDVRHWIETTKDGLCLHLHRPEIGAMRQVYLTPDQWELLNTERNEEPS